MNDRKYPSTILIVRQRWQTNKLPHANTEYDHNARQRLYIEKA